MTDFWNDIKTIPRNGRSFIAKDKHGKIFQCQYAPIGESLGWYAFIRLPERTEVSILDLHSWKKS